jgi:tRNA 2-thiouridine synthesizing protein A
MTPDLVVDARGMLCPMPVIELARRLPELPAGGVLALVSDDPAAAVDVPAWCELRGQEYLGALDEPGPDARTYLVRVPAKAAGAGSASAAANIRR